MKNKDTRIKMTKAILKNALLDILEKKSIDTITITEVCDQAGINRGTFYLHYATVVDVLEEIENEQVQILYQQIAECQIQDKKVVIPFNYLNCIESQKQIWRILLGPNGNPRFFATVSSKLKEDMLAEWRKEYPQCDADYLNFAYDYVVAGCTSAVKSWLASNCQDPCIVVAAKIGCISRYCLKSVTEMPLELERALNDASNGK